MLFRHWRPTVVLCRRQPGMAVLHCRGILWHAVTLPQGGDAVAVVCVCRRAMQSIFLLLATAAVAQQPPGDPKVDFARDVLPILQSRCLDCHGPQKQRGGLRLDQKGTALEGGDSGKVIVPGNSAASPLIKRVTSKDSKVRMP